MGASMRDIRTMHPDGFRSGRWAALLGEVTHAQTGRLCYLVRFPDGMSDWWVIDDMNGEYEFRDRQPADA